MFQGFYNLASGMLTQHKNLAVISNNLVNVKTPGYRSDTYLARTFQDEVFYRMGNVDRNAQEPIGSVSMARVSDSTATDFIEGGQEQTGGNLDFALGGKGFFKIRLFNGGFAYTRNGAFSMDQEGALTLPGVGRVQGEDGDIFLLSDAIHTDSAGGIYDEYGEEQNSFTLVDFGDYGKLIKGDNAAFTTGEPELEAPSVNVTQGYLEQSNVDALKETTSMMESQRAIQNAAQLLKIYDGMMGKAVTEIGKV